MSTSSCSFDPREFTGKRALVNGGTKGIGGSSAPRGGALALNGADWQLAIGTNLFGAVGEASRFAPA
jgi:hypothetical protein